MTKEKKWFEEDHNKIALFARQVPILILGDHSEDGRNGLLDRVITKLITKEYHSTISLKEVSRKGNHIHCERRALRRYPVIIKLDGTNYGTIGENILIACDRVCQEKTFLFIKETPEKTNDVFSINHYFLYFPRTYFCKDDEDMIEKSTKIAIRESYRLAYVSCDNEEMQSKILNTNLDQTYIL